MFSTKHKWRITGFLLGGLASLLILRAVVLKSWMSSKRIGQWESLTGITQSQANKILGKRKSLYPLIQAQALHETGNLSSNLFLNHKNLFGMKPDRNEFIARGQVTLGNETFNQYDSYHDSLRDLVDWMDRTYFPDSVSGVQEYVQELKLRGYFTAPMTEYLTGMQYFLKK